MTQAPDSPRAGSAKQLLDRFEQLTPSPSSSTNQRRGSSPKPPTKDIGVTLVSTNPYLRKDRRDSRNSMPMFRKMKKFFLTTVIGRAALFAAVVGLSLTVLPIIYFGRRV